MDDLFRWMTVRAPQAIDAGAAVTLSGPSGSTSFQDTLYNVLHPEGDPPANPWPELVAAAQAYQATEGFAGSPSDLTLGAELKAFEAAVRNLLLTPSPYFLYELLYAVQSAFGTDAATLVATAPFAEDWARVSDSIVALFIAPQGGGAMLMALATTARVIALLVRLAAGDSALYQPKAVAEALDRTLLLPPSIFPLKKGLVKPVGIADLLVVRQHIARYERTDLSSIENVMMGETKKHTKQRSLMTEKERTPEVETTEVTEEELQTDERFELKDEISRVLKENLSVKAGVKATFSFDDVLTTTAKADVAYSEAKSDSSKVSTEYAKDVVTRAASKVTARALSRQIHEVTELFEERDEHSFAAKGSHTIGLYQWLSKVYTSQIFNFGKRMLFDLTVPEPAAFLLDAVASYAGIVSPRAPDPFTLLPHEIVHDDPDHPSYYGTLLATYGVVGFTTPPPPEHITVAKGLALRSPDPANPHATIAWSGELPIPAGYVASQMAVNGLCTLAGAAAGDFQGFRLTVGVETFAYGGYKPENNVTLPGWLSDESTAPTQYGISQHAFTRAFTRAMQSEAGSIPVAVTAEKVVDCSVVVELSCTRTDAGLNAWKASAYTAILQAYKKLQSEHQEQVTAGSFRRALQARLGGNPDENRKLERLELKKAAIQILSGTELVSNPLGAINEQVPSGVPQPPPPAPQRTYPRPSLALAQDQGRFIRFFEQAFEWENMTYLFYPYYWARPSTWYDLSLLEHDDPVFADFLRAGEARVVIPVRPRFEKDIQYFLLTGEIWGGGDMPSISDTDYLSIADEIKAATGAPAGEVPEGEPWDVRVPTTLIRLRDGSTLPTWIKSGDWTWSST
jgi:hypothetical protein